MTNTGWRVTAIVVCTTFAPSLGKLGHRSYKTERLDGADSISCAVESAKVTLTTHAADAPFIDTPRDAREHYSKRFGIESSYRLAKQSLAFTSSQDAGLRLIMFRELTRHRKRRFKLYWRS
jgi:IS4 transposase